MITNLNVYNRNLLKYMLQAKRIYQAPFADEHGRDRQTVLYEKRLSILQIQSMDCNDDQLDVLHIYFMIKMTKSQKILVASLLIITLLTHAHAKMYLEAPAQLATYFQKVYGETGIPYSIANYGVVPYSKTVSGRLGIPTVLEDCIYEEIDSNQRASIIMVQRNDCTFTQKSINVQKEGGKLAIIMDSQIQQPGNIVMIDDGHGFQVSIPTILISSEDGNKLLASLTKNEEVVISVHFESVVREKADVSLWIDITNHNNMMFVRDLENYYSKLQNQVDLSLNYPIQLCTFDCDDKYCLAVPGQNSTGYYCRYPRFTDWNVEKVGHIIIWEQLRQYYIFDASPKLWFKYIVRFDEMCTQVVDYEFCGAKIIKSMKINDTKVLQLVSYRSELRLQEINWIVGWQNSRVDNNILFYPSVIVNGIPYRGNLQPFDVFELICESITPFPKQCELKNEVTTLNNTTLIILVVIIVVLFMGFLTFCFRGVIREQLARKRNKQVDELVNQYITMFEEQRFAKSEVKEVQMSNK